MNASFQTLVAVGGSALPEAPLISESPFYKQPQMLQPQTGWVMLSEARRTRPGGSAFRRTSHRASRWVRGWRWRGQHTLLEKTERRHEQSLPTVIPESVTSISFFICPKNVSEQDTLLASQNFDLQFVDQFYF